MRLIGLLPVFLLLSACLGGGGCNERLNIESLSLCVPKGWEMVPSERLRAEGVPEETLAVLRRSVGGSRDNVVATREVLPSAINARLYAQANLQQVQSTAEYMEVSQEELEVDGDKTLLHVFTAKPIAELPARRFYQVSLTKGTVGYVLTGTLPFTVEEDDHENMRNMLISLELD